MKVNNIPEKFRDQLISLAKQLIYQELMFREMQETFYFLK